MPVTEISCTNFRSFRSLCFQPGRLTVIIGSNAAGKSNILRAFSFIRDCARHGLANGISLQGGGAYLLNTTIRCSSPLTFLLKYTLEQPSTDQIDIPGYEDGTFTGKEFSYQFSLAFSEEQYSAQVIEDILVVRGGYHPQDDTRTTSEIPIEIMVKHENGRVHFFIATGAGNVLDGSCINLDKHLGQDKLLLSTPFAIPGMPCLPSLLGDIRVYDFDPRLAKRAIPFNSMSDLEESGQNLPLVLNRIIHDPENKTLFYTLIKDLLPFVDEIVLDKFIGTNIFFALREDYNKGSLLPASAISDGTILIADLIIALFFEENPVCLIEEPEKNLHPYLISRVAQMLKDASYRRQILVSTHHPEMVKFVNPEDLLLVTRDADGFSQAIRPMCKREIVEFLKNDIGIEELFIQNLLGME